MTTPALQDAANPEQSMHPTLGSLQAELAAVLTGLDARHTQATPRAFPGKWSIQQTVEHLLLTYAGTAKAFTARLDRGSPTRAVPTLAQRLGHFYIVRLGRFPYGRKAPESVRPASPTNPQSGSALLQAIYAHLQHLDALANQAESAFGRRRAISHAVLGPMPVESWRIFHLMHGRHHIHQIKAIRNENSFLG